MPDKEHMLPEGLSLRDWFAGQALPEIMRRSFALSNNAPICGALMAESAYDVADAMLAERAETTGEETNA